MNVQVLDLPGPWKSRPLAEFPFGAKIKIKEDPGWKTEEVLWFWGREMVSLAQSESTC